MIAPIPMKKLAELCMTRFFECISGNVLKKLAPAEPFNQANVNDYEFHDLNFLSGNTIMHDNAQPYEINYIFKKHCIDQINSFADNLNKRSKNLQKIIFMIPQVISQEHFPYVDTINEKGTYASRMVEGVTTGNLDQSILLRHVILPIYKEGKK